eukprot:606129_1
MAHFFTRFVRRLIRPRLNQHSLNHYRLHHHNRIPIEYTFSMLPVMLPIAEERLTAHYPKHCKRGDVDKDVYQKQLQDMRIRKKAEKQTSTTHYKKRIMNHYNTKKRAIEHSESLDKWMTPQPAKRRRIDKEGDKKKKQNDKEEASP